MSDPGPDLEGMDAGSVTSTPNPVTGCHSEGDSTRNSGDIDPKSCHPDVEAEIAALPYTARTALAMDALVPIWIREEGPGKFSYPAKAQWAKEGPPTAQDWRDNWAEWRPRPGHGIAVHLGKAGLMLTDLDQKNGHNGITSYESVIGQIHSTLTELTPRNGMHLMNQAHPALLGLKLNAITNLLDGMDIKWGNQIAVCAPTVRPDGEYIVLEECVDVLPIPPKLLELIVAYGSASHSSGKRAISDILTKGTENGRRDDDVTRLMFWMGSRHIRSQESYDAILADTLRWNRENCRPPLPESTVAYKVRRLFAGPTHRQEGEWDVFVSDSNPWELTLLATKQGNKSVGVKMVARRVSGSFVSEIDAMSLSVLVESRWLHLGPQMKMRVHNGYFRFQQAQQWHNDVQTRLLTNPQSLGYISVNEYGQIILAAMSLLEEGGSEGQLTVTASQLMQSEYRADEWLVEGLVQKGVVNVLVANGGGLKTTLAMAMAIAVGCGRTHSPGDVVLPGCRMKVFYYTAEDKVSDLQIRVRMLMMGRDPDDCDLVLCDGITDEFSLFKRIRQEEGERSAENFRIIDSVSAVFGDLNDNSRIVSFIRGLSLAGGTTLLLAHSSKNSIATGRGDPMGGIQWRNQARHVLHMTTPEADPSSVALKAGDQARMITTEKHNGSLARVGSSQFVRLNCEPGKTMWFGQAEGMTAADVLCAGIVSGVRSTGVLYAWADEEHGVKPATAKKAKQRLVESGFIVEIEKLLYLNYEAESMTLLGED